jgi:hypothetical protein
MYLCVCRSRSESLLLNKSQKIDSPVCSYMHIYLSIDMYLDRKIDDR